MSGGCVWGAAGAGEGATCAVEGAVVVTGSLLTGECTCAAFASGFLLGCCLLAELLRFGVADRRLVCRLDLARGFGLLTLGMVCPSCCANTAWSNEHATITAAAKSRYLYC